MDTAKGTAQDRIAAPRPARIGLVWSQFAPYHSDRCEAVGARLAGRYEPLAIEVASTSRLYAWEPSRPVRGVSQRTLFANLPYEDIAWPRRLLAMLRALWRCRAVFIGIGYNEPDVIALIWLLRLAGKQVVVMSDSKFDDRERSSSFELVKRIALLPVSRAIVAGSRQTHYLHALGQKPEHIVPGYDCVSVERVRREAGQDADLPARPFAERHFLYVGRFVAKKNLARLLEGYALYARKAGPAARRLQLAGSGSAEAEAQLRQLASDLGVAAQVDFLGQLSAADTARTMAGALGLILYSLVEQWGLVINEALALGVPVIVSTPVGARDLLVRNLVNGYVVPPTAPHLLAIALADLAADEARWRAMTEAALQRAWAGDAERFADAVEATLEPGRPDVRARIDALRAELA